MTEFMNVISTPDALNECVAVSREVMGGEYYKALLRCRKLIAFEKERLSGGGTGTDAGPQSGQGADE